MNIRTPLVVALLLLCASSQAAENVGEDKVVPMTHEMKQNEETARAEMENYWSAQPEAAAVIHGQFLANLKKLSWPDPRPEAREKYFIRPEIKVRELKGEEADPLLSGLVKKEKNVKNDLEAAQIESDEARYKLWKKNVTFFQLGINSCEAGNISGAERVALLEALQSFIKEGIPRFYLRYATDGDAEALARMSSRVKALITDLYRQGQYVPDYRSMLWAERIGGHLAGGMSVVNEKEKRSYYKIIARLRAFDPRAPQAEAEGGETQAVAPVDAAKDTKMEAFLQGLVSQCDKTIAGLNVASATPSQHTEIGNKAERAIRKMLDSFPDGWQKYPRARWAHGWFSDALEKSSKANAPADRGMALFKALDRYEVGLKSGL